MLPVGFPSAFRWMPSADRVSCWVMCVTSRPSPWVEGHHRGFKAGTCHQNLAAENAALRPIFLHTHHSLASIFTAIVTVS